MGIERHEEGTSRKNLKLWTWLNCIKKHKSTSNNTQSRLLSYYLVESGSQLVWLIFSQWGRSILCIVSWNKDIVHRIDNQTLILVEKQFYFRQFFLPRQIGDTRFCGIVFYSNNLFRFLRQTSKSSTLFLVYFSKWKQNWQIQKTIINGIFLQNHNLLLLSDREKSQTKF